MAVYLDASAVLKLVSAEEESDDLRAWLHPRSDRLVSVDIVRTEVLRAAGRLGMESVQLARAALDVLHLEPLTTSLTEAAGVLLPGHPVRTLDALHVAAALGSGDDLESFVTYDRRQADAARLMGLRVVAPGQDGLH